VSTSRNNGPHGRRTPPPPSSFATSPLVLCPVAAFTVTSAARRTYFLAFVLQRGERSWARPDAAMVPFEGNAPNLAGTVITLVVLGSIVLPLRLYVRLSNRAFGVDDWLMAIAAVSHKVWP